MIARINYDRAPFIGSSMGGYRHLQTPVDKKRVALAAQITILTSNNTPDASHENCAPLGVTYTRKTPPTHLVSSAHQGGYLFLGGVL